MKKKVIIGLLVVSALVFAACGRTEQTESLNPTQVVDNEIQQTRDEEIVTPEPTEVPELTEAPKVTEEPEATATPEPTEAPEPTAAPSFDNSWASNEFEQLIPQPPVGENLWKTEQKDSKTYRITTTGANLNLTVFMDYVNSLPAYGFSIEESMADYIYIATDANGNEAKLLREGDVHQYTITKVK